MQKFIYWQPSQNTEHIKHIWFGPLGLHLFWPKIWRSEVDWCWKWYKPVDNDT